MSGLAQAVSELTECDAPQVETRTLLALPLPANLERIAPYEMPTDVVRFKAWGDYACTEWPADLMIDAFNAWLAAATWSQPRDGGAKIEAFRAIYGKWWLLSEDEKEKLMAVSQRESPNRQYNRLQATKRAK